MKYFIPLFTILLSFPYAFSDEYNPDELKQACDEGNENSCYILASLYERGIGVKKDQYRAIELYQIACEGMVATACHNVAVNYMRGDEGIPKNPEKAVTFFNLGCIAGQKESCFNLAVMNEQGIGIPKNSEKAAVSYENACSLGDANGCFNRGIYYYNGIGGEKLTVAALRFFRLACKMGQEQACAGVEKILLEGDDYIDEDQSS